MENKRINIKVYLFSFMLTLLSVGASFLSYGVSIWVGASQPFPYYITMLVFIFIYGLLAYLVGDIEYLRYKKKVGEYKPSIPIEERTIILDKRLPFVISLIINLLIIGVLFIISLFMKRWPLL